MRINKNVLIYSLIVLIIGGGVFAYIDINNKLRGIDNKLNTPEGQELEAEVKGDKLIIEKEDH